MNPLRVCLIFISLHVTLIPFSRLAFTVFHLNSLLFTLFLFNPHFFASLHFRVVSNTFFSFSQVQAGAFCDGEDLHLLAVDDYCVAVPCFNKVSPAVTSSIPDISRIALGLINAAFNNHYEVSPKHVNFAITCGKKYGILNSQSVLLSIPLKET